MRNSLNIVLWTQFLGSFSMLFVNRMSWAFCFLRMVLCSQTSRYRPDFYAQKLDVWWTKLSLYSSSPLCGLKTNTFIKRSSLGHRHSQIFWLTIRYYFKLELVHPPLNHYFIRWLLSVFGLQALLAPLLIARIPPPLKFYLFDFKGKWTCNDIILFISELPPLFTTCTTSVTLISWPMYYFIRTIMISCTWHFSLLKL